MTSQSCSIVVVLLAACLAGAGAFGCEPDQTAEQDSASPWRYDSEKAPYAVEVPGQWQQKQADKLNRFADLAVHIDDHFYVIVIPQELPSFEDVKSPDASVLKRASLGLLKERIDGFKVEREGPTTVDDEPALTVFAEGLNDERSIQYINTYVTHGEWGYQVVAWGPRDDEDGLVAATEQLLAGWTFTDQSKNSAQKPGRAGDEPAGTDDQ